MADFKRISFIILILAIGLCSAVPPRSRQRTAAKQIQLKQRSTVVQKRVLARQEAVTPYPSADELKPEVPFEEGNTPDEVYGPPDETYGPPEIDQTPADQLPSEEAPEEFAPNPDAEEFQTPEENPASPLKAHVLRLTTGKKLSKKSLLSALVGNKKQRLTASRPIRAIAPSSALPLSSYRSPSHQYVFSSQPFAYSANYRAW